MSFFLTYQLMDFIPDHVVHAPKLVAGKTSMDRARYFTASTQMSTLHFSRRRSEANPYESSKHMDRIMDRACNNSCNSHIIHMSLSS